MLSEDSHFNVNPRIIELTTGKRMIECLSGKGGLEGLVLWMRQLDFVPDLASILNRISYNLMFYDTTLTKCAKEALKRPLRMREEEIAVMLGYRCSQCGKVKSTLKVDEDSCGCGGEFDSVYLFEVERLIAENINPVPEAVMMSVAYDGLAEAYFLAFQAFKMVLASIVKQRGWDNAGQLIDYDLKDRLDYSFYYGEPGDLRIAKEEREILMIITRGNLSSEIKLVDAEKLINLGIGACKYGHLFNQLYCSGADAIYNRLQVEYLTLYNELNTKIRLTTAYSKKEREKRSVEVLSLAEKQYYPFALLPREMWTTGKLAKNIVLQPLIKKDIQFFTDDENVAMNCDIAPSGKGKTTKMSAMVDYAVNVRHEYVFNVLGDEKNGLTLACLPLFSCEGHTNELIRILAEMGLEPKPVPTLNLVFLRRDEKIRDNQVYAHPPTIFDRIVEIDDLKAFGFEFLTGKNAVVESKDQVGNRGVLNILKEFALKLGYKDVCGVINVRNLLRSEVDQYKQKVKPDIQVGTLLFEKFMAFRQNHKSPSARVLIDELSRFAPVQHANADTSQAASSFNEGVKGMRGIFTSVDVGTQKWSEVQSEAKAEAFNICFRELPKASDKAHSQRELVLGSLDLVDASDRLLVSKIMETKEFPVDLHFWFWWNKLSGVIEVIRPNPPRFMINQPRKSNLEVFRAYERVSGEKVLLDSWADVPRLYYEDSSYFGSNVQYS